jgi:DNA-binding Xre family transcriptional regulator
MVRLIVREVAERAGIRNAHDLMKKADLQTKSAYALWNGTTTRIDVATLNRLCNLFRVPPGQLFDYKPDTSDAEG